MDTRELSAMEHELATMQATLKSECQKLGARISEVSPAGLSLEEASTVLGQIRDLNELTRENRERITELGSRVEKVRQIEDNLRYNEREIRKTEKDIESHYRDIGEFAYEAYKTQCHEKEKFAELFQEAMAVDGEIEKLNAEIQQVEAEAKNHGFFAKTGAKARVLFLKGAIGKAKLGWSRAYHVSGEKVSRSDFGKTVTSEELTKHLDIVEASRKLRGSLEEDSHRLREEKAKIEEEIKNLIGEEEVTPAKRMRELEHEIADARKRLPTLHQELGRFVVEAELKSEVADEGVQSLADGAAELRRQISAKGEEIEKMREAIEEERRAKAQAELLAKKAKVEEELRAKQADIEEKLAALQKKPTASAEPQCATLSAPEAPIVESMNTSPEDAHKGNT